MEKAKNLLDPNKLVVKDCWIRSLDCNHEQFETMRNKISLLNNDNEQIYELFLHFNRTKQTRVSTIAKKLETCVEELNKRASVLVSARDLNNLQVLHQGEIILLHKRYI
jgi:hypothetical protein